MARQAKPEEVRTFILTLINGNTRKITVPATWKLTFGSLVPYIKSEHRSDTYAARGGDRGGVALRFYEGNKENLRAVMTDVLSFREDTMKVLEKHTTTQRKVAQKDARQGSKNVVIEATMTEWVDPDLDPDTTPSEEFTKLPTWGGEEE